VPLTQIFCYDSKIIEKEQGFNKAKVGNTKAYRKSKALKQNRQKFAN
jgi:hypothetical protein